MRRNSRAMGWMLVMVGAFLALPVQSSAQMKSWQDVQVEDLEGMKTKFTSLGAAFAASDMEWRPMEGTRSVHDVLALIAAECNLFPTMWGYDAPEGTASGFGPEIQRLGAMSQDEVLAEMEESFDFMIEVVAGMDQAQREAATSFFGQDVSMASGIALAMADMHEHLGQLIAYARANEVVPPWSRG